MTDPRPEAKVYLFAGVGPSICRCSEGSHDLSLAIRERAGAVYPTGSAVAPIESDA
jgi:hypothetical protein